MATAFIVPICYPVREKGVLEESLEKIMKLYARVKTWEIESVIGQLLVGYGDTWTFNQGVAPLGSINANTEKELACAKTFIRGRQIPFNTPYGFAAGDLSMVYFPEISKKSDDLYQIYFYVLFEVGGNYPFFTNKPLGIQDPQGAQIGFLTLKPINITAPIYGGGSITGTMNISVRATEWWSYDGKYDTETGELINP